jgi:hypothetical protein
VCEGIQHGCVNWDIVTPGSTDEEKALNSKYAISIARMLGAVVFCVWEDIVAIKEKMILVFICSLHDVAQCKKQGHKSPIEEAKTLQGTDIEESKAETIESTPNEEYTPAPVAAAAKEEPKEEPKKAAPAPAASQPAKKSDASWMKKDFGSENTIGDD